jgi:glycine/D-amino acid oxidase-like deaminating enzyme
VTRKSATATLPRPADRSWWLEEAFALPEFAGEPCPPLGGDARADVVILGGGYTGMWTAWFLKERDPGIDVVILEADICGGGPSGRNGGFCNALWEEADILIREVGEELALQTCLVAERSIEGIREWCEANGVDAWITPGGHMGVATSEVQDDGWRDVVDAARKLGAAEGRFVELTAEEVRVRCESPVFRAGVLTPRTTIVQPARLARGLRRVLLERGVRIYEGSPVARFRGGPPAEVVTRGGSVRAEHAVLGLNAWASQLPRFRRIVMPRASYIVITEPAPEKLEEIGWTGGEGIYDFRTALHYLRTTPDGRLAFGAGGSRAGIGTGLGPRLRYDERSIERLMHDMHRMFPSFRDVRLEAAWGGPIDVTGLHLPSFGTLPSGNVCFGHGYTGGGVGPCHMGGQILSGLALGVEDEYTRLPLVGIEPRRLPPEPLLSVGAAIVQESIVRKDEAEDDGRRPNPFVDFLARLPRRLGYNLGP